MQRRIVKSFRELNDRNAIPIYEEIKIKKLPKTAKGMLDRERGKGKYIKGDPESKGKSEAKIEDELEELFKIIPDCAWWSMKVKGELQSTGNGQAIIKESPNRGFPDYLLCINGLFIGVEAKACGRYQSPWQIDQEEKIKKRGCGLYFCVTSVRELIIFFTAHRITWRLQDGTKR